MSIQSHSSEYAYSGLALFCVDGNTEYNVNVMTNYLIGVGVPFKKLRGCYEGVSETSFMVIEKDFDRLNIAAHPLLNKQESILKLSAMRREYFAMEDGDTYQNVRDAELHFRDGKVIKLPPFRAVTRDVALAQSGWTYDPKQDQYFTCLPVEADQVVSNIHEFEYMEAAE